MKKIIILLLLVVATAVTVAVAAAVGALAVTSSPILLGLTVVAGSAIVAQDLKMQGLIIG